jgi:hypothetical protein
MEWGKELAAFTQHPQVLRGSEAQHPSTRPPWAPGRAFGQHMLLKSLAWRAWGGGVVGAFAQTSTKSNLPAVGLPPNNLRSACWYLKSPLILVFVLTAVAGTSVAHTSHRGQPALLDGVCVFYSP